MTGIKGYALLLVGILIFSGTCIYVAALYDQPRAQEDSPLKKEAREMMRDIRQSDALVAGPDGIPGTFDPDKVTMVHFTDLEQKELEFQLEIIDISGYEEEYSRSLTRANQIQSSEPPQVVSEGEIVTIESAASIQVGPDEVHAARLVLRVWEA